VLTAAVFGVVGYGGGRVWRALAAPVGGQLTIGPGGIELTIGPARPIQLLWSDIKFVAVVPTRSGFETLLVKAVLNNGMWEPLPLKAKDLGIVGLCRVGVAEPHCDQPAVSHGRGGVLASLSNHARGAVARTRKELLALDARLGDRI
jgi:hypothetical protein